MLVGIEVHGEESIIRERRRVGLALVTQREELGIDPETRKRETTRFLPSYIPTATPWLPLTIPRRNWARVVKVNE